jgi:SNF2 family DNA or RNA helicase
VGYGKTAITLGLIDSAEEVNGPPPEPPKDYRSGYIGTKATLVVVPKHLVGQWPDEVKKFLGNSKKVCVIKDLTSLNNLSIDDIQHADIVIVSFAVLNNEKYFSRLARLSGVNPASLPSGTNGSRHFAAVYNECLDALPTRVTQIVKDCPNAYGGIIHADEANKSKKAEGSVRLDGKKTVYKNGKPTAKAKASEFKIVASEKDPWGLSTAAVKKNYRKMSCPPLEMFFWNRLVVDE